MSLRLIIDGARVRTLDDVHDDVARLPGLPDWFGRNLDALAELAYFVPEPLTIEVRQSQRLRQALGPDRHRALIATLEAVRDSENDDAGWQPVTLKVTE